MIDKLSVRYTPESPRALSVDQTLTFNPGKTIGVVCVCGNEVNKDEWGWLMQNFEM